MTPPVQKYKSRWMNVYETEEGWSFASRKIEKQTVCDVLLGGNQPKPDAVVICATIGTEMDQKLVAIKQYRPPIGQHIWELPAGLIEENEDPVEAGLREFEEETGMVAEFINKSPVVYASPGFCDESAILIFCRAAFAPGLDGPSKDKQEEAEDIDIHLLNVAQAHGLLEGKEPIDVRLALCLQLFIHGAL